MAAYLIADVKIVDPERFKDYGSLVPESVEKYGGKYLVRGGEHVVTEGNWDPERLVVIEFKSMEQLKEWYDSEEYSEAMNIRTFRLTQIYCLWKGFINLNDYAFQPYI